MQAVHKLSYIPDLEAAARARHHNDRIAVIAPLNTYPGFTQRLRGVSKILEEIPAELIIFQMDIAKFNDAQNVKLVDSLASSGRYDGLIIMSLPVSAQDLTRISSTNFPTALIETSDSRFTSFNVNNVEGARMAVQHLIDRGYKDIGYVGFNPLPSYSLNPSREREQGYIETLLRNGRSINPANIIICDYSIEHTREVITPLLKKKNHPDAFFCGVDISALGVLRAAQDLGIRVPEDLGVIGFDDIEISDYLGLSTIRQPLEGSGKEAALLISKLIKDPASHTPEQVFLPLELVVRATS